MKEEEKQLIEVNLSKLEMMLIKEGEITDRWPICAGKPTTPTPKGNYFISFKVTQDTCIHSLYRHSFRKVLKHLPFFQLALDFFKQTQYYPRLVGVPSCLSGLVILKNEAGNYISTGIHSWPNFKSGYFSDGCIRMAEPHLNNFMKEIKEGTRLIIY